MWASTAFSSLGLFYPLVVWLLCVICSFQSFQSAFSTLLLFAFFIRAIRHLPLSLKFRWVHLRSLCQIPAPPASWMSLEFFSHSELLTAPVQNTSSVYLSTRSPLRASVLMAGPQLPVQLTVYPNWLLVLPPSSSHSQGKALPQWEYWIPKCFYMSSLGGQWFYSERSKPTWQVTTVSSAQSVAQIFCSGQEMLLKNRAANFSPKDLILLKTQCGEKTHTHTMWGSSSLRALSKTMAPLD